MARRAVAGRRNRVAIAALVAGVCVSTAGCGGIESMPLPRPGMTSGGGYLINATFDNALNLPAYAKVRVNGADIGSLESMRAENYEAITTLRIDDGVELPKGTTAELRSATPLGDVFVALHPPTDPAPGTPLLKDGDAIERKDTASAATVESILSSAALLVNGGAIQNMTNIVNGFGRATGDKGEALGNLISQTNQTLGKLNARSGQIKQAMGQTEALALAIEGKNTEITDVLREAGPATAVLRDNTSQIMDLVVLTGATTRELEKFPAIAGTDTSGRSMVADLSTIAGAWNDVSTAPGTDLYGLNRLMAPVIKSTPSNALSVRTSIDRLILGHIPDIGFPGDLGYHGPKWNDFQQLVGAFKYTLWRLQERIVGKGPDVPQVPVIPSPTEPDVLIPAPQGPPPGPAPAPPADAVGPVNGVAPAPGVEAPAPGQTVVAPAHGVAPAPGPGPAPEAGQ